MTTAPDVSEPPPWRRPPRHHFPGVPAWGAPTATLRDEKFDVSLMREVSPEWAWGGSDGSGVRVAVLDSGVDGAHPMIKRLVRSVAVVPSTNGELAVEDCEPADAAGHGTACAGLINAFAPEAALTSVRVLANGKMILDVLPGDTPDGDVLAEAQRVRRLMEESLLGKFGPNKVELLR